MIYCDIKFDYNDNNKIVYTPTDLLKKEDDFIKIFKIVIKEFIEIHSKEMKSLFLFQPMNNSTLIEMKNYFDSRNIDSMFNHYIIKFKKD